MEVREEQLLKHESGKVLTLSGIIIVGSDSQPQKHELPNVVKPLGRVTDVRALQ